MIQSSWPAGASREYHIPAVVSLISVRWFHSTFNPLDVCDARNIRLAGRASDVNASVADTLMGLIVISALKRLPLVRFVLIIQLSLWPIRGTAKI